MKKKKKKETTPPSPRLPTSKETSPSKEKLTICFSLNFENFDLRCDAKRLLTTPLGDAPRYEFDAECSSSYSARATCRSKTSMASSTGLVFLPSLKITDALMLNPSYAV